MIAGRGRDERRLRRLAAEHRAPVTFFGRIDHDDLPLLHAAADVFAMPCRTRWGGLEQEGFGIVFVEAAAWACRRSPGSPVVPPRPFSTASPGWSCARRSDPRAVAEALEALLEDEQLRHKLGAAGRERAVADFSYDVLTSRLATALEMT